MVMSKGSVIELVNDQLLPMYTAEQQRLARIDKWYRWDPPPVQAPRKASPELKKLIELSKTPWLRLVVSKSAQNMHITGYRSPAQDQMIAQQKANAADPTTESSLVDEDNPFWRLWQTNGLDRRQGAIWRGMLAYGVAYGLALPGEDPMTGARTAVMRGVSARKMLAVYADAAEDDWPLYALRNMGGRAWRVYDDEVVHYLGQERSGMTYIEARAHEVGVTPVARFTAQMDLDGRTDGEVEPFISIAQRLNKDDYDRLMIQHFQSWQVRTIAGMAEPATEEEANRKKLQLSIEDLLIAEDHETKFGTLPATSPDGVIKGHDLDVRTLGATSQTPVHALTGDLINLNTEALAAANADHQAKVDEYKLSAGDAAGQWGRLGCHIIGERVTAADMMGQVTWADTSVRSMGQIVDALGKMAQMLGIPPRALWNRVPGVTDTELAKWGAAADAEDGMSKLADILTRQSDPLPS